MFEESVPEKLVPFAILGLMLAIYLHFAGVRQKDRDALAERLGLGHRDELPDDFPLYLLDSFNKWEHADVLSGFQNGDVILTFDIRYGYSRRQETTRTVVARRFQQPNMPHISVSGIFYRDHGPWRVALQRGPLGLGYRRLSAQAIEELWDRLA